VGGILIQAEADTRMIADLLETSIIISILAATVRIATPILLAAIGEMIAERSGVYNMGLEGTMLMSAFTAYIGAYHTGSLWLGVIVAMVTGSLMSLVFAFLVITLKVEQIVTGLALNLLGSGLSIFWLRAAFANAGQTPTIPFFGNVPLPLLSDVPFLGPILFDQKILTYLALLAVPAAWYFLFRTRYGLELRCAGENPKALDIKGIDVAQRQYAAVVFGGLMAGLGGAFLTVGSAARFVPEMNCRSRASASPFPISCCSPCPISAPSWRSPFAVHIRARRRCWGFLTGGGDMRNDSCVWTPVYRAQTCLYRR
jgi:general nucleoside transport system permease protein